MSNNRKDPVLIIKELTLDKKRIKFWNSISLKLTYSSIAVTVDDKINRSRRWKETIVFPLKSRQLQAMEFAIKSFEEIIPIQIDKVTKDYETTYSKNIRVFNADIYYSEFSDKSNSLACAGCKPEYKTKKESTGVWGGYRITKDLVHLNPFIIYHYSGAGKKDVTDIKSVTQECELTDTMRHELGHILGLAHPKDHDSVKQDLTIMSYEAPFYYAHENINPVTLQLYDVLVLQNFYGQNKKTRKGNTYYNWDSREMGKIRCLWDGGGSDTIDLNKSKYACILDMRDGEFSSLGHHPAANANSNNNFSLAYSVGLEKANASSKGDLFFLNMQNNVINGGRGNDAVYITDKFINLRIHPRNLNYINRYVAKQDYVDSHQYRGWGHNIFYDPLGQNRIILDVDNRSKLTFKKTGKNLTIIHRGKSIYGNTIFKSSITITHYHPYRHMVLLRYRSKKMGVVLTKRYEENVLKARKLIDRGIFKKSMIGIKHKTLSDKIKDYDQRISKLTKTKMVSSQAYLPISI